MLVEQYTPHTAGGIVMIVIIGHDYQLYWT
jgi:hypothetical protein